ncbi:MAG TPA: MBL fold metallo-hydrolase [Rhodospirillales bacterium]|nr:MBL fold metallo-hydrolase [Rhodospirillales bacterium]
MIFRQLFDATSSTFTYLLGNRAGGEALIIDPVFDNVDRYIRLLDELDLRLVKALDTHVHADHVTGLGALRDRTRCVTVMGRKSKVDVVSMRVEDGERIEVAELRLTTLYTPGHTDDSYCFLMDDRVFTGDTLLIRGTGRTDFQNGDPLVAYDSLFNKLLRLPDETVVYPGHDYNGNALSTIGEERARNPRLQVASAEKYAAIMSGLDLDNPRQMDVAVPANLSIAVPQGGPDMAQDSLSTAEARARLDTDDAVFVDLREEGERIRDGVIPGSVYVPYVNLDQYIGKGGLLGALASGLGKELILYCAFGERSVLALPAMREAGLEGARHVRGGLDAWIKAGGPVDDASVES